LHIGQKPGPTPPSVLLCFVLVRLIGRATLTRLMIISKAHDVRVSFPNPNSNKETSRAEHGKKAPNHQPKLPIVQPLFISSELRTHFISPHLISLR